MHVFGTLPHKLSCAIHEIRFPGTSAQRLFERYQEHPSQFRPPKTGQSSLAQYPAPRSRDEPARGERRRDRLYRLFRHYRNRYRPAISSRYQRSRDRDTKTDINLAQHWPSTASFMDLMYPSSHALQVPIKHDSPLLIEYSRSRLWLGSSMESAMSLHSGSMAEPFAIVPSPSFLPPDLRFPAFMPHDPPSPAFMPFALHSPLALPTLPPPPVDTAVARGVMISEHNEGLRV